MDLSTWYSIAKSMHLIGMVSWMAGMFYLVRIMVNHALALTEPEPQRSILSRQYALMEGKAYRIILQPAVVMTWSFGVLMLCIQPAWLSQGWLHAKGTLLVLLTGYTHYLKSHIRQLEQGTSRFTHVHYRALNEVPTIFLAGIVFLAVFKDRIHYGWLVGGLMVFAGLIGWGVWKATRQGR